MIKLQKQILQQLKNDPVLKSRMLQGLIEALEAGAKIYEISLLYDYVQEKYNHTISEKKLRRKFRFYWMLLNNKLNEK